MYARLRRRLTAGALIAIAGCGGGATPPGGSPGTMTQNSVVPASIRPTYLTNKSLVFVADAGSAVHINIYEAAKLSANPPPIATIHLPANASPEALALDKAGTLYVADPVNNAIELYRRGSTTLSSRITDGIRRPFGLAIDSKGTLYVANVHPPSITEYAYHTSTPSKKVTGGGLQVPIGLTIDKQDNLYIADSTAFAVFKLPAGGSKITNLRLSGLGGPAGLAIDPKNGYLWETSPVVYGEINIYKLASGKSPIRTITDNGGFPNAIGIAHTGKPLGEVVVSDEYQNAVYAYRPGRYTPYATLTNGISGPTGLLIAKP